MRAIGRISWRTARLEIIVVLAVGAAVTYLALDVAQRLAQVAPTPGPCLDGLVRASEIPPGCSVSSFLRLRTEAGRLVGWVPYLPWVLGVLLGSQVVAREVDRGTAVLAWSLSGGRLWWLVGRAWVPILVLVLACGVMAYAMGQLVAAKWPWLDPWASFHDMGAWGPPLLLTGVVAFTLSLAVGAVTGRQVLALVVGLLLCGAVAAGVGRLTPYGMADELIVEPVDGWYGAWLRDEVAYQRADGTIITGDEVEAEFRRDFLSTWGPEEREAWAREHFDGDPPPRDEWVAYRRSEWFGDNFDRVQMGLNGDRFPEFVLRQSLLLAAIAMTGAVAAGVVVRRRRPS